VLALCGWKRKTWWDFPREREGEEGLKTARTKAAKLAVYWLDRTDPSVPHFRTYLVSGLLFHPYLDA
jgi:hypothetical protein